MNSPLIVNKLIWLDANVNNFENTQLLKSFSNILPNLIIYPCDSLEKGFEQLYKLDFELTFIMISGRLFEGYIMKLKNEFSLLKSIPLSIVYTSKSGKEQLEGKQAGNYAFNPVTLASVKDPFLNPGGVCDHPKEIAQFIINFNKTYYDENYYKESKFNENLHNSVNLQSYFVEKNIDISKIISVEELIEEINELEMDKNEFVKILLSGIRNFEINTYELYKLIQNDRIIKIKDQTKIKYDLEKIANETTLKGLFAKEMLDKINDVNTTEELRQTIEKAIEIGFEALE